MKIKIKTIYHAMNDSICTYDEEIMKIMMKMKRKGWRNLRLWRLKNGGIFVRRLLKTMLGCAETSFSSSSCSSSSKDKGIASRV